MASRRDWLNKLDYMYTFGCQYIMIDLCIAYNFLVRTSQIFLDFCACQCYFRCKFNFAQRPFSFRVSRALPDEASRDFHHSERVQTI
jgi:hypothetical protein